MIQRILVLLGLALLLTAGSVAAACPQVQFRVWTSSSSDYFNHGDTLSIAPGRETHLYIHHRAQGSSPFRTSAKIGHAVDFGIRGATNRGVVAFQRQSHEDRQAGRLVLTPDKRRPRDPRLRNHQRRTEWRLRSIASRLPSRQRHSPRWRRRWAPHPRRWRRNHR